MQLTQSINDENNYRWNEFYLDLTKFSIRLDGLVRKYMMLPIAGEPLRAQSQSQQLSFSLLQRL